MRTGIMVLIFGFLSPTGAMASDISHASEMLETGDDSLALIVGHQLDSLRNYADTLTTDSLRLLYWQGKAQRTLHTDPDLFLAINDEVLNIWRRHYTDNNTDDSYFFNHQAIQAIGYIGLAYAMRGDQRRAMENLGLCLKLAERINDVDQIAAAHNCLGYANALVDNNRNALNQFKLGLDAARQLNDTILITQLTTNLGALMVLIADSAAENNNVSLAEAYRDSAMIYLEESKALCMKTKRISSLVTVLNNMANVLRDRSKLDEAMALGVEALELSGSLRSAFAVSECNYLIATVYRSMEKYREAVEYGSSALEQSQKVSHLNNTRRSAELLYTCYEQMGDHANALRYYDLFIASRDTLSRTENRQASIENELDGRFLLEVAQDSAEFYHRQKLIDAELAHNDELMFQNRLVNNSLYVFSGLFFVLLILVFRRMLRKRRDHRTILLQKDEVDLHRQKMLRSIAYAERIQRKILPGNEDVRKKLPGFDVFYSPCEIVSGDFYWFSVQGDSSYLALGDCTGHGVPGAFMTMLGTTMLNEIVARSGLTGPVEMLEHLDRKVRDTLRQYNPDASDEGMEIAVLKIDHKNKMITFSGASQHLYILRETISVVKGDMRSIGGFVRKPEKLPPFTDKTISFEEVNAVYLITDGLEDQFNGTSDEKFGRQRVMDFLYENRLDTMKKLDGALASWCGGEKQVDDVSVIELRMNPQLLEKS